MHLSEINTFTRHYLIAALWSSTDEAGNPLDADYSLADLSPESIKAAAEDCTDFQTAQAELLEGIDDEQAGHDFWLTRNRHGTGFWDRGLGEIGKQLTDAAHVYGEVDLYVGDDGQIHSN